MKPMSRGSIMSTKAVAFAFCLAVTSLACGGGDSGTPRPTVLTPNTGWVPSSISAEPGDPVIFTINTLRAQVASTSPTGLFQSKILEMGQAFEWKVPKDISYDVVRFEDMLQSQPGTITIVRGGE